jgi:acetylornithine deacetylase/succinyl-diaminopimelate desuccinylase-like protein
MAPNFTARVDSAVERDMNTSIARLRRLVGQPSVSSQNTGMEDAAELVAGLLEQVGFSARLIPHDPYPVVYAEAEGVEDKTLICYNHYDVQPAEPLDLWHSPPFEMVQRDGKLYGRGVSDDKGEIAARLAALHALRQETGDFPCRIKFLIEGGEEISSPGLPDFVEMHRELLASDACLWEGGGVGYDGRPSVTLGMRGILYVQYNVQTLSRDAHSGSAHLLPNAAWRLIRALERVADENGHILIPGFYDDAREPTNADLAILSEPGRNYEEIEEQTKRSYGIDQFNGGATGVDAERAVFQPTANIAGFSAGYQGAGPKTVTPSEAMAKMDFRLIPDQDPEDVFAKLRAHLTAEGFDDVEVTWLGGERAAKTDAAEPLIQATVETAQEVYGLPARITPMVGGSGPMYAFREYLNVPITTAGVGYPDSLVHAPDENIRVEDFVLGTKHIARLIARWAGR